MMSLYRQASQKEYFFCKMAASAPYGSLPGAARNEKIAVGTLNKLIHDADGAHEFYDAPLTNPGRETKLKIKGAL
jgi:hypothetical protein